MARSKSKRGFKRIVGKKGKLHRALGVPEDQPIPPGKRQAALRSRNPKIRSMAINAFKGALAAGRKTAQRHTTAKKSEARAAQKISKGLKKK